MVYYKKVRKIFSQVLDIGKKYGTIEIGSFGIILAAAGASRRMEKIIQKEGLFKT